MPEANFALSYPMDPPKRPPIIKVSCGIGDTDGFPAFDVESDNYAAPDDPKWGFRITGGAEFHMPITVFQVTDGGLADKGGIRLGDIILEINETDVTNLPLAKVQEIIDSSAKKIHIVARGMEDDEMNQEPQEEDKSVVLRVPKPLPPPKEFTPTPLLGTRVWHPIMWQEPPPPPKEKKKKTKVEIVDGEEVVIELSEDESSDEEEEEELPHHRIIRNIRRFFTENKNNNDLRDRTIEDMLLILPASIEERLREMQRKLSEIAEIPKILSSTLDAVSQTFGKFLPPEESTRRRSEAYESDLDSSASDDNGDVLSEPDSLEMVSKYKDLTPESDYVSETNEGDDDDIEQMDNNEDESDEEQQYTWNSSNVPEVNIEETEEDKEPTAEDLFRQEKQEKIEKLDRAWPWADREKIIYKQSTCHLVPRQPLGIVEDRIKLLARQNIAALYERRQAEN